MADTWMLHATDYKWKVIVIHAKAGEDTLEAARERQGTLTIPFSITKYKSCITFQTGCTSHGPVDEDRTSGVFQQGDRRIRGQTPENLLWILEASQRSHPGGVCVHDAHSVHMLLVDLAVNVEGCTLWVAFSLQDLL